MCIGLIREFLPRLRGSDLSRRRLHKKSELIFDPNFPMIVVFSSNWIDAKKKAATNYPSAQVENSNFAWIKHFRTRESGHRSNLRERMIKVLNSYRNSITSETEKQLPTQKNGVSPCIA
jgi:hypothetical protein